MKNAFAIVALIAILYGCGNRALSTKDQKLIDSILKDSIAKRKTTDAQMALGNRPDSEQEGPTAAEVLKETLEGYTKIEKTDNVIVDGTDSLKIHMSYYCLHDSTLIVPAKYDWRETPKKDFITNNFAAKIVVIKNRDTVFNHVILKSWFNKIIDKNWKPYVTIVSADFYKYDKTSKHLVFDFSVSIPTTDLGIGATLLVDKNGGYEITK